MAQVGDHFSNILYVNTKAIEENYAAICQYIGKDVSCAAILQSDAYGVGANQIMHLLSSIGCNRFFVASLEEALALRQLSMTDMIFVRHGIFDGEEQLFLENNVVPVLNEFSQIDLWNKHAIRKGVKLPAAINIDTGLHHLGLTYDNAIELLRYPRRISNLEINHIMSDLIFENDHTKIVNRQQLRNIVRLTKFAPWVKMSLASSLGIFLGKEYHFDMVRVGLAIFGILPLEHSSLRLRNAFRLVSRIIQIKEIAYNHKIGYYASNRIGKNTKIAIVEIGFNDGFIRNGDKQLCVSVADVKVPVVGNVSTHLMAVDVTNVPENELYEGAEVEVLNNELLIQSVARSTNMNIYEIIYNIASRCKKIYISEGENA